MKSTSKVISNKPKSTSLFPVPSNYKHKKPNKQESKIDITKQESKINITKLEVTGQDLYKERKDQIQSPKLAFSNPSPFSFNRLSLLETENGDWR
ncbi:hypothetical protein Lal_00006069 [Lupinus albus]|nr:hypothetical protein Lal_00006069 [Lupinus albus]